jgi:hypothetical protein
MRSNPRPSARSDLMRSSAPTHQGNSRMAFVPRTDHHAPVFPSARPAALEQSGSCHIEPPLPSVAASGHDWGRGGQRPQAAPKSDNTGTMYDPSRRAWRLQGEVRRQEPKVEDGHNQKCRVRSLPSDHYTRPDLAGFNTSRSKGGSEGAIAANAQAPKIFLLSNQSKTTTTTRIR